MATETYTILVVDDEEAILDLIQTILEDLPHKVLLTSSPQQAIEILRAQEIALLLCDMSMPGVDGNFVLSEARKVNPNIVSILVTGRADTQDMIKAINEGGIWKFISKPWDIDEFVAMVE